MPESFFNSNGVDVGDTIRVLGYTEDRHESDYDLPVGHVSFVTCHGDIPCIADSTGILRNGYGLIYEIVSRGRSKKKPRGLGAFLREHGL